MIEIAIMQIMKAGIISVFFSIVAFPSIVINQLSSWFYNEPEEQPVNKYDPTLIMKTYPTEDGINSELLVLERLNKARDNAKNPAAKQMWEIKKAEYIRKLKWRQLEEIAHASERVA